MARQKKEIMALPDFFELDTAAPAVQLMCDSISKCTLCGAVDVSSHGYRYDKCANCGAEFAESIYSAFDADTVQSWNEKTVSQVEGDEMKFVTFKRKYYDNFRRCHNIPVCYGGFNLEKFHVVEINSVDETKAEKSRITARMKWNLDRHFKRNKENAEKLNNAFGVENFSEIVSEIEKAKMAKGTCTSAKTALNDAAFISLVKPLTVKDVDFGHVVQCVTKSRLFEYAVYCSDTDSVGIHTTSSYEYGGFSCPVCGKKVKEANRDKISYEKIGEDFCLRSYRVDVDFDTVPPYSITAKRVTEYAIIRYESKKKSVFTNETMYSSSGSCPKWQRSRSCHGIGYSQICGDIEEFVKTIRDSSIKYSGVAEYIEDQKELSAGAFRGYMQKYYQEPGIKLLYLGGLKKAVDTMYTNSKEHILPNPKASKPRDLLGITKPQMKALVAIDPDWNTLVEILKIFEIEPNVDPADLKRLLGAFKNFRGAKFSAATFVRLKKEFSISVAKALDYLENTASFQCIPSDESVQLWLDYLQMATALKYRMDNKNTIFPHSLKLEHDKAVYAFNAVSTDSEAFMKRIQEKKNLEFTYDKLLVKLPDSPSELVDEGRELKHCCASYVQPVTDGKTVVMFIREKENPEIPYYTVKVDGDKIFEVAGYCNHAPSEKNVLEFLDHWSKFKGLSLAIA